MSDKPDEFAESFWQDPRGVIASEVAAHVRVARYWDRFYDQHPRLRGHEDVVAKVMEDNPEIADLPMSEATAKIAARAERRVQENAGRRRPGGTTDEEVMRGGLHDGAPMAPHRDDEPTESLSDVIRERRQAAIYGRRGR